MNETISIIEADLSRPEHQEATLHLLNAYAMDLMGDGRPLSETGSAAVPRMSSTNATASRSRVQTNGTSIISDYHQPDQPPP